MKKNLLVIAAMLLLAGAVVYAQEPPQTTAPQTPTPQSTQEVKDAKYTNESVGRLSFVEGKAYVQRASDLGYEEAALNMPISEGDRIGTSDGRLEVHFGRGNYVRLDSESKVDILNLPKVDDDVARFRVWSGSVFLVVGSLKKEKAIELHTADSSFYVLDKGVYRVNVHENKDTEVLVYQGLIEAAGEEGSTLLKTAQKLEISEGRLTGKPSSFIAVADDAFDKFNESRTSVTGREFAKGKLPEELSDFEGELDEYGEWTYLPPYGNVWVPNGVDQDWRPYYNGRWTWLPLSGWTWWPYEPWGWSTFHYGRWHWGLDLGWYWIPMSMWGPAWVDWWWDDFYFGWAPLSYWGYPGVLMGGMFYGHYYGGFYPHESRALTVVRRDHLKDPHIAANALRGDSLKGLGNRMTLTNRTLSLRPTGTKIQVEPMNGSRVMLRNGGSTGLTRVEGRTAAVGANANGPRAIRRPDAPTAGTQGTTKGTTTSKPAVKSTTKTGERSSATARTGKTSPRNIRKSDDAQASTTGQSVTSGPTRTVNGYPSSPRITGSSSHGTPGAGRIGTYSSPSSRTSGSSVGRTTSGRSGSSVRSSGRSGSSSRGSSSRGSSRGSSSRGSSSRGSSSRGSSSGSRGSSGSHGSSGGGVHRR